jgi:uncharacterized protein RhaS with RHS repeats
VRYRRLVCSPGDDHEFVCAATLLAGGDTTAGALESGLQSQYPKATVHEGTSSTADGQRWYAYRDGRWAGGESRITLVDLLGSS